MANSLNKDNFLINLKELASKNSLDLSELKEIINFCGNFFSQDLPQQFDKSFNLPFLVQGFSGKTFKLVKSNKIETQQKLIAEISQDQSLKSEQKEKIIAELKKQQDKILEENIFVSDLLAFLEQSSILLAKFLNQNNKQALAKLGSDFFNRVGLAPKAGTQQILLKELEKIEQNPNLWQKINTDLVQSMLTIVNDQENQIAEKENKDQKQDQAGDKKIETNKQENQRFFGKEKEKDQDNVEGAKGEPTQNIPENFSQEFNLAKLDDLSKLYIRSLAIISINQTLQIQFANLNKKQLLSMGFDQIPNFNQLSIENRQKLLTIAFSKIENLLASGRYDLHELINTPSLRISFAKDTALKIMVDIRGGEIFAREIGKLTKSNLDPSQVKIQLQTNQAQNLDQKQLNKKLNVNDSVVPKDFQKHVDNLSSEEAEDFFKQFDTKQELRNDFSENIKKSFTRVTKNNFLGEWQKIVFSNKNTRDKAFLAQENILPIIDVFIQQNYPIEYLEHMDWNRFQAHFGRDIIDQNTFLSNQQTIKNLLSCYWRSQRAEWSRTIHHGIDTELYSVENLEELWKDFSKNDQKIKNKKILQKRTLYFQQLKQQAQFNVIDSDAVTKKFAGFSQNKINLSSFNEEQIANLNLLTSIYQQNFLNVINNNGPSTQMVTLNYYFPGEEYGVKNALLKTDSLSQFSAYDLGVINYNQSFGPDDLGQYPFINDVNEAGGIDAQLQEGFGAVKNVANQAIDFVGEKAVRAGLNYATGGAFEALPEPIKQMVEKVAWSQLKKTLEPIIKIIIAMTVAALAALITLILKFLSFFGISLGGGVKEITPILAKKNLWSEIADGAESITSPTTNTIPISENNLAEQSPVLENQISSKVQAQAIKPVNSIATASKIGQGAMATASQAVLTTFGLVAGGTILYQAVINGAFLTQFPTGSGGGGGGGAVYCNDVLMGNMTYYSQKDYRDIHICGDPGCQFGDVACGPTSVAMILNEDPVEMSIREGYLYCGKTTCSGSSFSSLIDTLNSNGVHTWVVPLDQGSPTEVTDQISQYLAEGNVILARTDTHGIGHFYIIVCVESPGTVTAWDPWWGKDVVHQVGSDTIITDIALVQN